MTERARVGESQAGFAEDPADPGPVAKSTRLGRSRNSAPLHAVRNVRRRTRRVTRRRPRLKDDPNANPLEGIFPNMARVPGAPRTWGGPLGTALRLGTGCRLVGRVASVGTTVGWRAYPAARFQSRSCRLGATVRVWVVNGVTAADGVPIAVATARAGREVTSGVHVEFVATVSAAKGRRTRRCRQGQDRP